jgi:CDP-paratose 2-epimerase
MTGSSQVRRPLRILITGGAGFIGTNLAARYVERGAQVVVLDSLARPGSEINARWLQASFDSRVECIQGDIRDRTALTHALRGIDHVVHLAAQVAVTTSLSAPLTDFDVNVGGTLLLLEAIRSAERPPSIVFTSTNKVYGALEGLPLTATSTRYVPADARVGGCGVGESWPLSFHSPYGCSKGAADQYVLDYARSFGLRAIVLRMSCIYGPHQNGNEDQGWVAHFVLQAHRDAVLTIYGDGRQVRDLLYIDDLLDALELAHTHIDELSGTAFNMGGGATNALSVIELIGQIEALHARKMRIRYADWRVGDQRYYVSDTSRFRAATGWQPRVMPEQGLIALNEWLAQSLAPQAMLSRQSHNATVLAAG